VEVGPLGLDAVRELAAASGLGDLAERIAVRTSGHTLFVVESIRALRSGDDGIPESLTGAVRSRVGRLEAAATEALQAAAVLGPAFTPGLLATVLGASERSVLRECEQLAEARLVLATGPGYEFANDLIQEAVYATTPEPVRDVLHRRAADASVGQPELEAAHAAATGQWERAARSWLSAAASAAARFAAADAERLLDRALAACRAEGVPVEMEARVLLARGRERETLRDFPGALEDFMTGIRLARSAGATDLEMLFERELGGDSLIATGRPVASCMPHLHAGLRFAEQLGDQVMQADCLARLAILNVNQLDFVAGREYGERGARIGREAGDPGSVLAGLDGLKASYAYLGEVGALGPIVDELEPLARRAGDLFRLQWIVFERAFIPLAAGDWGAATTLVEEALALNRRSGRGRYEGWFIAHLGWIARLDGRMDDAIGHGRRSVALLAGSHAWWDSITCSILATTLLDAGGESAATEATVLLRRGLAAADRSDAVAYRLRCLAQLADVTGAPELRAQATFMLEAARFPDGTAWLHGWDAYLALTRAWLADGNRAKAAAVLVPFVGAARSAGWDAVLATSGVWELAAACGVPGVAGRR
jgi:hypothetical protein